MRSRVVRLILHCVMSVLSTGLVVKRVPITAAIQQNPFKRRASYAPHVAWPISHARVATHSAIHRPPTAPQLVARADRGGHTLCPLETQTRPARKRRAPRLWTPGPSCVDARVLARVEGTRTHMPTWILSHGEHAGESERAGGRERHGERAGGREATASRRCG